MTSYVTHRLDGLEPDNLLAFMALLGLLRTLEEGRPEWHQWHPRVYWTVDEPPLRPALRVPEGVTHDAIVQAAAKGLNKLASLPEFGDLVDLKLTRESAIQKLQDAAENAKEDRYTADLWAAFLSDVVIDKKEKTKPTPLCLLGSGRTNFINTFKSVSVRKTPPKRRSSGKEDDISEYGCLNEALFRTWRRPDKTDGNDKTGAFRWDPQEDVRHAYRWHAPTDNKEPTQHGANRLAAIGLSVLTAVPKLQYNKAELAVIGIQRDMKDRQHFYFDWPIWREPVSLAGIRALLSHPYLYRQETRSALGIVELRRARKIFVGKYMNFTRAEPISAP